jgi:transposase InsO family protein
MKRISYSGYRFPPTIIQQAIWLYLRFTLSLRDVEDLLAERGITVSYESIRRWIIRNHAPDIAAIDLFVVPTVGFRLLYGLVIIHLERSRLIWTNVTTNPTAEWIARQITEAFPWDQAPRYLIRDRDGSYGVMVERRIRVMGIRDRPTAARSPWQNGHIERLIGSIRRECLDHVMVQGEAHLRRIFRSYADYYNRTRTHLALEKDAPLGRPVHAIGQVIAIPLLGGLHHQYARMA